MLLALVIVYYPANLFVVGENESAVIFGRFMETEKAHLLEQKPLLIGSGLKIKPRYGGCVSVAIPKAVDEEVIR